MIDKDAQVTIFADRPPDDRRLERKRPAAHPCGPFRGVGFGKTVGLLKDYESFRRANKGARLC